MEEIKILIVDDDSVALLLLEKVLSDAGYSVVKANNGQKGVIVAKNQLPDLIILDILMPDIDGGRVAKILEKDPKTKDIPIIFLTSIISKKEENLIASIAGRPVMAKPFDRDKLLKKIQEILDKGRD